MGSKRQSINCFSSLLQEISNSDIEYCLFICSNLKTIRKSSEWCICLTMVRFKKRYFVMEYERAKNVEKSKDLFDLEPLNSKDIDIAEAVKNKVTELHGDFGRAAITVGFKVIYANRWTRLVIMRVRHGPHKLVASALPFVTEIRKEVVVGRLLYTGATIRHCHLYMVKRQKHQLELANQVLRGANQEQMEQRIMDIRQID